MRPPMPLRRPTALGLPPMPGMTGPPTRGDTSCADGRYLAVGYGDGLTKVWHLTET